MLDATPCVLCLSIPTCLAYVSSTAVPGARAHAISDAGVLGSSSSLSSPRLSNGSDVADMVQAQEGWEAQVRVVSAYECL